jgi:hypothetical protein
MHKNAKIPAISRSFGQRLQTPAKQNNAIAPPLSIWNTE